MMKVVLKLELRDGDEKAKKKAMTIASSLSGVESVAMDMKDKKLTITGNIDPVKVVGKLRKLCGTEIVTVGPVKQEDGKKKEDGGGAKKEDPKKPAGGGDDQKNKGSGGDDKKTTAVKVNPQAQPLPPPPQFYYQYQNYPPQMFQQPPPPPYSTNYYNSRHPEQDQSDTCVIS